MLRAQIILSAIPAAFGFLHLFLYIFYPRYRLNLYQAGIMISFAVNNYFNFLPISLSSLIVLRLSGLLALLLTLRLCYAIFPRKVPKHFIYLVILAVILAVATLAGSDLVIRSLTLWYFLLILVEIVRVLIKSLRQKLRGARLFGLWILMLSLVAAYEQLMDLLGFPPLLGIDNPTSVGSLLFIVFISVYLAWNFANTRKRLDKRTAELKELNLELEARVERRTEQLAEANQMLESRNTELAESKDQLQETLSRLQKTYDELRQTQTQLVQSAKMASLGNLAAGVAHEVNNPLGAVNSAADTNVRSLEKVISLLKERKGEPPVLEDPRIQKAVGILQENSRVISLAGSRMAEIVSSLRNFARLDEAEYQDADIHEGLESSLVLLHHLWKDRIEIVKDYGKLPLIPCFPNQLNQVFMNVLKNAIQAIEDEGTITVKTRMRDKNAEVRISDSGRGIKPENLDKIFDPGFTTKGVGVGTGLGLSISFNIIQQHHGTITVQSTEGKGSQFVITLPSTRERSQGS